MREDELQRRRLQRHAVAGAHLADPCGPVHHLWRGGAVVERGAGTGAHREDAAVVRTARDDRDPALEAVRQELGERSLVQERVPPGEQEAVAVALPCERQLHLPLVHTGADGLDHPSGAELDENGEGFLQGLLVVVIGIMDEHDVDALESEARERGLE
jgi:hypothetical protein